MLEKFMTKLANALPGMFRFVTDPPIPATNNAAERALRELVIHRKVRGSIREMINNWHFEREILGILSVESLLLITSPVGKDHGLAGQHLHVRGDLEGARHRLHGADGGVRLSRRSIQK